MNISKAIRRAFSDMSEEARVRAYLNNSVSMTDLERRMREVDSGRFRRDMAPF